MKAYYTAVTKDFTTQDLLFIGVAGAWFGIAAVLFVISLFY